MTASRVLSLLAVAAILSPSVRWKRTGSLLPFRQYPGLLADIRLDLPLRWWEGMVGKQAAAARCWWVCVEVWTCGLDGFKLG